MNKELKEYAKKVSEATGWRNGKAVIWLFIAQKIGLTPKQYISNEGWIFSKKELKELKTLLELKRKKQQENKEWYIRVVCEKTGWTPEVAERLLTIAKKKGYTYRKFVMSGMCRKTEAEIKALPVYKKRVSKERQAEIDERRELAKTYRENIMKEMGWSLGRVRLETMRAQILCGCTGVEFYTFKIYKNGIEEGNKFLTQECNSKMKVRWGDWGGTSNNYFQIKGLFNQEFKDFVHRKWFLNKDLTFEKFEENVKGLDKIIFKPYTGMGGNGVEIFKLEDSVESRREVYEKICKEEAIIEEVITQHRKISEFYPHAVNTIRVMSFVDNGEPKVLNAVMKFSTQAVADNFHLGGLVAGVDVETGKLCTNGVDYSAGIHKVHPYSGKEFKGFQIPNWDKLVETVKAASKLHSEVPYIGWDISITDNDEIEIVEGNHRQAIYLIQFPFACDLLEGRRHTIENYLWFDK